MGGSYIQDYAGWDTSMSNDGLMVAVGAYGRTNNDRKGSVKVYALDGNSWIRVGQEIRGEANSDYSGYALALSGDGFTVAIGAHGNDGNGTSSGHVRVYDLQGNTWTKVGQDIDGQAGSDQSGFSVAISDDGTTVAVGANKNDGNALQQSGHVRVFGYVDDDNEWKQIGQDIRGEAIGDESGSSVAMSWDGSRVAIGAPFNHGNGYHSGQVRVFYLKPSDNQWTQLGDDINGEAIGDQAGRRVAMSKDGSVVAIGGHQNDDNGSNSGHVRIYALLNDEIWVKVGQDIDGEAAGDDSGASVDLSRDGSVVVIGAWGNDESGSNSGHARVYSLVGNEWFKIGQDINGENPGDRFGSSVAISDDGSTVAIGAYLHDATSQLRDYGHVKVYRLI